MAKVSVMGIVCIGFFIFTLIIKILVYTVLFGTAIGLIFYTVDLVLFPIGVIVLVTGMFLIIRGLRKD